MKPQEALQLIDQAVSQISANREVHIKISEALNVIRVALNKPVKSKPVKK